MNIYDVHCNGWIVRVKASSFSVAISKGVRTVQRKKGENLNSVYRKSLPVRAVIFARNVDRDAEIPPIEKDTENE